MQTLERILDKIDKQILLPFFILEITKASKYLCISFSFITLATEA